MTMLTIDESSRPTPPLPTQRGALTRALLLTLLADEDLPTDAAMFTDDPLSGDDFHLALYLCYELSYRGLPDVDASYEADLRVMRFRQELEQRFEHALRSECTTLEDPADAARAVDALLDRPSGPSLSSFLCESGTREQFLEFMIHRSAYQLKEADPHTWAIPRVGSGRRKSALLEIQLDEYGGGEPGESHAELFDAAMEAAALDPRYGAYTDVLPGTTLATCNLISMFGLRQELTAALLGHLAVFEMTSVEPMARYAQAVDRLGLGDTVREFYEIHVDADVHHGELARETLIGGDLEADDLAPADVLFGAEALMNVERRFADTLLTSWARGQSSLLPR